jgi:hypothetical protein
MGPSNGSGERSDIPNSEPNKEPNKEVGKIMKYYIISITHTRGEFVTLWQPNNSGYTTYLDQAGEYSEEDVNKNPNYYNNNRETLAVPCEKLRESAKLCVPYDGVNNLFNSVKS